MFENAKWICLYDKKEWGHLSKEAPAPCPYMVRDFELCKDALSVKISVCGLGQAAYYINGERIPGSVHPTQTSSYQKGAVYNIFDVTSMTKIGKNRFGAVLGHSCYADYTNAYAGVMPAMIAQIDVIYKDGASEKIVSNSDFLTHASPTLLAYVKCGEKYDANKEIPDWSCPEASIDGWRPAAICAGPGGKLRPAIAPAKVREALIKGKRIAEGLYDFGEHLAGCVRIEFKAPHTEEIKIRYSEWLTDDGENITHEGLHNVTYNEMRHTDIYIPNGKENAVFEPLFTYHGFRYVKIDGICDADVYAVKIHTDIKPLSDFESSVPLLNAIHTACRNSLYSCAQGSMVDCPQREQNEWTGDLTVSSEMMAMEYDAYPLFMETMRKYADDQAPDGTLPSVVPCRGAWTYRFANGTDWSSVMIFVPYFAYLYTGDTTVISENWDRMVLTMEWFASRSENELMNFGVGDWVSIDPICNIEITDTAYYRADALMMAKMADVMGFDSKRWSDLADRIRTRFCEKYVKDGRLTDRCYTAKIVSVAVGMLEPDEAIAEVRSCVDDIKANGYALRCGVHGFLASFRVLPEYGENELIFKVLTNTEKPGYAKAVSDGLKTLPEGYNYRTATENRGNFASLNHYFTGMVDTWFIRTLAGIDATAEKITVAPWISDHVKSFKANCRGVFVTRNENSFTVLSPRRFTLRLPNFTKELPAGKYEFNL